MDPANALRQHRDATLRIARSHGARKVRVFGSVARAPQDFERLAHAFREAGDRYRWK